MMDGWITARRFGIRGRQCYMGCQEEDSLQHYANCTVIAGVAARQFGLHRAGTPATRLQRFLLVDKFENKEELIKQARWTGTVFAWHNLCRRTAALNAVTARTVALKHCLRDTLAGSNTASSSRRSR